MAATNASNSWVHAQSPSTPLSMVDFTVPGIFHISENVNKLLLINSQAFIVCIVGIVALLSTYMKQLQTLLHKYYTCTIHVKRSSEAFDMLLDYVTSHEHGRSALSTIARIHTANSTEYGGNTENEKLIRFDPWDSCFQFRFKNKTITYRSELRDDGFRKEEVLSIACFGRSSQVLKELIAESRREYLDKNKTQTIVFENYGDGWKKARARPIRPLEKVIIGPEQQKLIDSMREFLDPQTQKEFSELCQPYRKGYLFYGSPGTGKTSFSCALAGEFHLDIYVVNLASLDDNQLRSLFSTLPARCIVLLEDVDATGTCRSIDAESSPETPKVKNTVSLSGLLNVLDGVASSEGRVLIMTTCHPENLDKALIRPGRVDMQLEFQLADSVMTARLFDFIYQRQSQVRKGSVATDLAIDFATRVPQRQLSSAQILCFLTDHRHCVVRAFQEVDNWVLALLKRRVDQKGCSGDRPSTSPDGAARNGREDLMVFGDEPVEDSLSAGCILPSLSPTGISGRPNTPLSLNLLQQSPNVLDDDVLWMKTVRYHDLELLTTTQPQQETITPPLLCPDANGDNRQGSAARIRSHSCGRLAPLGDFDVAINSNTILQPSNKQRSQMSSLHSTSTIISTLDNDTTDKGSRIRKVKRCTNLREASCIYSDIAAPEREETRGGGVTVTSCNLVTSGADSTPCLIRADSNVTQNASDVFTEWSFLSYDGSISSASVCTSDTTVDTEDTNFDMDFAEFMTAEAVVVAGELIASTAPNNNAYELEIISLGDFPFTDTWYLSTSSLDDAGEPYVIEEPNEFRDVEDAMTPHE